MISAPQKDESQDTPGVRSVMLRLPDELYEWLRREAFVQRRSMNALGIEALRLLRDRPWAGGDGAVTGLDEDSGRGDGGTT